MTQTSKCKCKRKKMRLRMGYQGEGEPKQCPKCKSYAWNKTQKKKLDNNPLDDIEMACCICRKEFGEGETIYRFQEGYNRNGSFVFELKEMQGRYCGNCSPDEKVLPFIAAVV